VSLDLWFAFVAASVVMLIIPGPTVTLVVSYALSQGRRAAFATAFGTALGDLVAMTLSLLGLGALLAASATLFTVVKVIGGAYLIYLGWKLWSAPVQAGTEPETSALVEPPHRMLLHAFAVTALNPKSIIFFVAFVPQFIDKTAAYAPQVVILVATFVILALINALTYALAATKARVALQNPAALRIVNRTGGGILVIAGASAASWRGAA
jgi:threonine/homoserine/homoserine lactone efflux protein